MTIKLALTHLIDGIAPLSSLQTFNYHIFIEHCTHLGQGIYAGSIPENIALTSEETALLETSSPLQRKTILLLLDTSFSYFQTSYRKNVIDLFKPDEKIATQLDLAFFAHKGSAKLLALLRSEFNINMDREANKAQISIMWSCLIEAANQFFEQRNHTALEASLAFSQETFPMTNLPAEIIYYTCSFLTPKDLGQLAKTCNFFKSAVYNTDQYKLRYAEYEQKKQIQIKIAVVGDRGAGKRHFIYRILHDQFPPNNVYQPLALDDPNKTHCFEKNMKICDLPVRIKLHEDFCYPPDTAQYVMERKTVITRLNGVFLLIDLTQETSYIEHHIESIERALVGSLPIVVLGTKIDDAQVKCSTWKKVEQYAQTYHLPFYTISSKTGANIQEAMFQMGYSILVKKKILAEPQSQDNSEENATSPKSKCSIM